MVINAILLLIGYEDRTDFFPNTVIN
jgi:hypothetical protein